MNCACPLEYSMFLYRQLIALRNARWIHASANAHSLSSHSEGYHQERLFVKYKKKECGQDWKKMSAQSRKCLGCLLFDHSHRGLSAAAHCRAKQQSHVEEKSSSDGTSKNESICVVPAHHQFLCATSPCIGKRDFGVLWNQHEQTTRTCINNKYSGISIILSHRNWLKISNYGG